MIWQQTNNPLSAIPSYSEDVLQLASSSVSRKKILCFASPLLTLPFYYLTSSSVVLSFIVFSIGMIMIVGLRLLWKNKNPKDKPSTEDNGVEHNIVLDAIFAVIAGLSLTKAIEVYADELTAAINNLPMTNPFDLSLIVSMNNDLTFRFISFFLLAIPFYHGGLVALLRPADFQKQSWKPIVRFLIFIIIFANSVILYLVALNIGQSHYFSFYIIALLFLNIVWIPIQKHLFKIAQVKNAESKELPIGQWIQINSITLGCVLVIFFLSFENQNNSNSYVLMLTLLFRSVLDYYFGWKSVYGTPIYSTNGKSQRSDTSNLW